MKLFRLFLISIGFLLFAFQAEAGLILQRPLYIGLDNGLVGYWTFDGPDMAGVTAYDRSGQGNTGILTGPVRAIGKIGQALKFDGSDDRVDMGDVLDFTTAPMTITAWILPDGFGEAGQGRIVDKFDGAAGYMLHLQSTNSRLQFQVEGSNVNSDVNSISLGARQHIAVAYDGANARFYVNGTAQGAPAMTTVPTNSTSNLAIGSNPGATRSFPGLIDEVRVYNRVLSADEIRRLYRIGGTLTMGGRGGGLPTQAVWSDDFTRANSEIVGNLWTEVAGNVQISSNLLDAIADDGSSSLHVVRWDHPAGPDQFSEAVVSTTNATNTQRPGVAVRIEEQGSDPDHYRCQVSTGSAGTMSIIKRVNGSESTLASLPNNPVDNKRLRIEAEGTAIRCFVVGGTESLTATDPSITQGKPGLVGDTEATFRRANYNDWKAGAMVVFANTTRKDVLTDGLVGHWTFDGPDMAGVTAFDRSGNNNRGTLSNGPVRRIGQIGQALEFDGSDDNVDMGDVLPPNTPFSYVAWIKPDDAGAILSKRAAGGTGVTWFLDATNNTASFKTGGGTPQNSNSNLWSAGEWVHTVFVHTGSRRQFYRNGVLWGDAAFTSESVFATSFLIGDDPSVASGPFNGLIDDVRVYNRVLSADEIKRLYTMGR